MPIICVFGDSTAWGAYDLEKGGWVNRLWLDFIKKDEGETEIYNLSISGGTTETILARFESEAKIRRADTLIFQTGGNDAAYDKNSKESLVSVDQFEKNIETIIRKAKALTESIIFIGFKNCDESKTIPVSWCDLCYTNEFIKKYNGVMKKVCDNNAVKFIDVFGLLDNSDFEDGLHPNANGHQKLFEVIKEQL